MQTIIYIRSIIWSSTSWQFCCFNSKSVIKRTFTILVMRLIFAGNFKRRNNTYFCLHRFKWHCIPSSKSLREKKTISWLPFLPWCSRRFDIYDMTMFVLSNLVVNFVTILPIKLQNILCIGNFPGLFQWQNKGQLTVMINHDYHRISNCISYQIYSGHRPMPHQLLQLISPMWQRHLSYTGFFL